jgi:hypothetical protein
MRRSSRKLAAMVHDNGSGFFHAAIFHKTGAQSTQFAD